MKSALIEGVMVPWVSWHRDSVGAGTVAPWAWKENEDAPHRHSQVRSTRRHSLTGLVTGLVTGLASVPSPPISGKLSLLTNPPRISDALAPFCRRSGLHASPFGRGAREAAERDRGHDGRPGDGGLLLHRQPGAEDAEFRRVREGVGAFDGLPRLPDVQPDAGATAHGLDRPAERGDLRNRGPHVSPAGATDHRGQLRASGLQDNAKSPANKAKATTKSFPTIAVAKLELAGVKGTAKADPKASGSTIVVKLPAGKTTLKAWFADGEGKGQCGAFFVTVTKK